MQVAIQQPADRDPPLLVVHPDRDEYHVCVGLCPLFCGLMCLLSCVGMACVGAMYMDRRGTVWCCAWAAGWAVAMGACICAQLGLGVWMHCCSGFVMSDGGFAGGGACGGMCTVSSGVCAVVVLVVPWCAGV